MEGIGKVTAESLHVFVRISRGSLWETIDHLESLIVLLEAAHAEEPKCSLRLIKDDFVQVAAEFDECYKCFLSGVIDAAVGEK